MDVHYSTLLPPQPHPPTLSQTQVQPSPQAQDGGHQQGGDGIASPLQATSQTSSINQGIQACQRCRQQKLRCSRESPHCTRCQRASVLCVYPPPPDRKLLAAQRVKRSRFRPYQEPNPSTTSVKRTEQLSKAPTFTEDRDSSLAEERSDGINGLDVSRGDNVQGRGPSFTPSILPSSNGPTSSSLGPVPVPSPEVARLLIEMFFTRVYNAALLYHKETFLAKYAANKLPNFVVHAIFALASIFLPASSNESRIDVHETELGISALSTSDFRIFAHEWAKIATQQVLAQVAEPSIENIQTCQILALYWFSKDSRNQVHILANLAYTSSRIMGFHTLRTENGVDDELSAEMKRRCLWSSWIMACISQENAPFKNQSWSEVVGLPLPADEASFASAKPEITEAFNENGKIVPLNESNKDVRTSVMGEMVKLFGLWWQVQGFVRGRQDELSGDPTSELQEFLKLDRRLEQFSEGLHADFKYSGPSSFSSTKTDPYTLFSLQCLYRLCACALHTSLVPLFSSTSPNPEISKKLVRMCAGEAVRHSAVTLDMATAFLNTRPDISRLSSMTGYTIFVALAVQVRSLGAQGKLKTHSNNLKAAVTILKHLNKYWSPLRSLWIKLVVISSFAGLDLDSFVVSKDDYQVSTAAIQTNIEQILSPEAVSETGQGTDIYTYVEQIRPRATSQQSSPANTGSHSMNGLTCPSPVDESRTRMTAQIERGQKLLTVRPQNGMDKAMQSDSVSDASTPFAKPLSDQMSGQPLIRMSFDRDLSGNHNYHPRLAEATDLYMTGSDPQVQLDLPSLNQQAIPSQQSDAFRPLMEDFDVMSGIMGMNMDLGSEEDDFWWTRSWGSVRIL